MDEPKRRGPFGRSGLGRHRIERQSPFRSFALGGLVGAAGTIATVRRLRRSTYRPAAGLAAFEDAPCFREGFEPDAVEDRPGLD